MFTALLDFLFPPRADERLVRELSEETLLALLDPREADDADAVALLPFHDERVRALVHEAKYHGSPRAFTLLAAVLAEYLRDADFFGTPKIALVPVPLSARRRAARGYNQAEEIARCALRILPAQQILGEVGGEAGRREDQGAITLDPSLLVRTRETPSQVSLPRAERLKNMRGAFAAPRPLDGAYLYIVIDDVVTTGATLTAATEALRQTGAENVLALAVAYA